MVEEHRGRGPRAVDPAPDERAPGGEGERAAGGRGAPDRGGARGEHRSVPRPPRRRRDGGVCRRLRRPSAARGRGSADEGKSASIKRRRFIPAALQNLRSL